MCAAAQCARRRAELPRACTRPERATLQRRERLSTSLCRARALQQVRTSLAEFSGQCRGTLVESRTRVETPHTSRVVRRAMRGKERRMGARRRHIGGLALAMIAIVAIGAGSYAQMRDRDGDGTAARNRDRDRDRDSDRDRDRDRDTVDLSGWRIAGGDLNNSRSQQDEEEIDPSNVGSLAPKWMFSTGGDVSATPTVAGNAVYFPDWAGNLYAVQAHSGRLLWSHQIAEYNGRPGSVCRVSPAIYEDELIIGDNVSSAAPLNGAHGSAVCRHTGTLRWITPVDAHPAAIITGSPVFHGTTVYVGGA